MKSSNVRRYLSENGCYATVAESYEWIARRIRGRLLYGRIRAKNLQLGPGAIIRGICCIRIGENFDAGEGLWLEAITHYKGKQFSPSITIENNVRFSRS